MRKANYWNFAWTFCILLIGPHTGVANFSVEGDDLFVVFNQPKYAPGDTAFFLGYLPIQANQSAGKKQVVSIKLLGNDNAVILQERVLFIDGVVSNQLVFPSTLQPGVYHLTFILETSILNKQPILYSRALHISDKSLSVSSPDAFAPRNNSMLNIELSRDTARVRGKVEVTITPGTAFSKNKATLLSIAVYNKKLFSDSNQVRHTALAMSPVQSGETNPYVASSNNLDGPSYFTGRAVVKSTGQPLPDQSKITFYLNKSDLTYEITTRSGYFTFPLFRNFESERIFYRISYKGKILNDSQIIPTDFPVPVETGTLEQPGSSDPYGLYAHQKGIIVSSYNYFQSKGNSDQAAPDDDIDSDIDVNVEKFEPFATMAEVFSNVVPMVSYRKIKGNESIRVFLQKTAGPGVADPVYIINGVMTSDTRYLLTLDPKSVQKIGILRTEKMLSRFGDLGREGILVIITKEQVDNMGDEKNVVYIEGINQTLPFKKVAYDEPTLKSKVPDLRSSLYWNPIVKFNEQASFEFYTSDDLGQFVIQIVGFQNGKPFISESEFFVTR